MAEDLASVAASSSSHVYSHFDVFLNHRGPDVKKGLAAHLYRWLKQHGLRVFLDAEELQQGDRITSQIEWAIRTASVHVAIFSPTYAESCWCLNELVMMLESRSTIIPVFYGVHPSELRWTRGENGVYSRQLRMLEKKTTTDSQTNKEKPRYDSNTVDEWRNALSAASLISGFELTACDGDEGQLVDQVVEQVLKKVSKAPLNVAQYPTGLEDKVKEFDATVSSQPQSGKSRVVGIVGLGGVGKSTLAKEFVNRHRSDYDRFCFVYDVRENAAKNSLNLLQATILKDLAQRDHEQINGVNEGIDKLKRYLSSSHRVLIVLDDVDDIKQLDALLLPVKDAIHPGSLIVVTSRNRDVLISSDIPQSSIYRLTGLNPQHSRELFCSHAFSSTHNIEGFDEVIDKFLDACQGLPLSLKVLGALVRGKGNLNHWKAQLRIISRTLPDDILSILKVSYDNLYEWEKQIFLDIACFLIGEDKDTAIRIWDGSDWEGSLSFWKLEQRCLVDVDKDNRIRMHDHLRDLGRHLAEKEHLAYRLWRPTENLLYDLSDQSRLRGLSMVHLNDPEQWFKNPRLFTKMSSLQLLWAEGYFVESLFCTGHLPHLIYLRWDNCPLSSLPFSIPIKNLRILYIQGQNLEILWQDEYQVPLQLRELHIQTDNLAIIPNYIGKLKYLEKFVLHARRLKTLAESVGNLTSLQSLDLKGCSALQMLPDSVGEMTSLQRLNLSGCSALQTLPDSVRQMTSLQSLDLSRCSALQMLPGWFGQMTSLQSLDLSGWSALQTLPGWFGQMTSLQSLGLSRCSALQTLPGSFGQMTNLQRLDLSRCSALEMLPDSVGNLTSLKVLYLDGCIALQMLPDSVGNLTSLEDLHIDGCIELEELPLLTGTGALNWRSCWTETSTFNWRSC